MSSSRSKVILALEKAADQCKALLAKGVHVNQLIVAHRLPVPPLHLEGIHNTLQAVEVMLREMELRAVA